MKQSRTLLQTVTITPKLPSSILHIVVRYFDINWCITVKRSYKHTRHEKADRLFDVSKVSKIKRATQKIALSDICSPESFFIT